MLDISHVINKFIKKYINILLYSISNYYYIYKHSKLLVKCCDDLTCFFFKMYISSITYKRQFVGIMSIVCFLIFVFFDD